MTTPPFVPLDTTRYQKGDLLGYFLALVSIFPVFIGPIYILNFIFRRELQSLLFTIGHVISMIISEYMKRLVKQERAKTCALLDMCHSPGWPSHHSLYVSFIAIYFTLLTYKGHRYKNWRHKWILAFLFWSLTCLTMYSRVYLGYHTFEQVLAGVTLGIIFGTIWFWVVNYVLFSYFPAIEESALGRMLYIKDTSHIPNVLKFEYDNARAARKHMERKFQ